MPLPRWAGLYHVEVLKAPQCLLTIAKPGWLKEVRSASPCLHRSWAVRLAHR